MPTPGSSADFTVVPDKLFVRIAGVSRHHDGYVTRLDYACVHPNDPDVLSGAIPRGSSNPDCKLGTEGNQNMSALRLSGRWTPNAQLEVNLVGDWTDDKSETQADTLLNAAEIFPGNSLAYFGAHYDNRFVAYGPNRGDSVINNPYVTYANFVDPGVTYHAIDTHGNPGAPNGAWAPTPQDGIKSWGVSGNVEWHGSDQFALTSITAYRHYVATSTDDNGGAPVIQVMELARFTHLQFSQELRAHGSIMDKIDYTVGGISPRPYVPQQTTSFGPETLNAYELGFKSTWLDHRLKVNVAGFYNQYDNYQAPASVCVDAAGTPLAEPFGTILCGEYQNVANASV